jgi:hypothetical protein
MKYVVMIDDPDMARSHVYLDIEAASQQAAVREAARRAILEDERGPGVDPQYVDAKSREEWAQSADLIDAVAAYAWVPPDLDN